MAAIGFSMAFVAIITFLLYKLVQFLKFKRVVDKIHGPYDEPHYVGNYMQFRQSPADLFEQQCGCAAMLTTPVRMFRVWLAWKPVVFLYGCEEAKALLDSNKNLNKSQEYKFIEPWMGLGLLTSYAEKWRPRRKLLTPTFHYDILKDFVEVFNAEAKIMVKKMSDTAGQGPKNYYQFITLCALDIICETAMGEKMHAQFNKDSEYVKAVYKIADIIHHRQKTFWVWTDVAFNYFGRGAEHQKCLNILHGFTEKVIKQRCVDLGLDPKDLSGERETLVDRQLKPPATPIKIAPGKRRLAFLDLLLDMAVQNKLNLKDVREEVDTFMFEGHDTTTAGMNWALHLIGLNPDIQAKLHKEMDTVFGDDDRDIEFEDLKQLDYLERCIKETLRLFPSVPMYSRDVTSEMEICGYKIPEGTVVAVLPYMVHRDPSQWPDPEKFDPDRFLPDIAAERHPFAYVPFSAGSRNCIGQRFALMEEKTVLAWIFRYFKVTSVERRDQVRPKAELILRPEFPMQFKLELRRTVKF